MRLWPFLLNFKDPASVYAYSMIFVHHQVMWYMIIILAVVYWSFYKIIKEYNWHSFNRRGGISFIFIFQKLFFYYIDKIMSLFFSCLSAVWLKYLELISNYAIHWLVAKVQGFFGYQSWGRAATSLVTTMHAYRAAGLISRSNINAELIQDKYFYMSSRSTWTPALVFSSTSTASKEALAIQVFRENLLLEYVWATFPSLVIFLILIPSLYLLYSLEERVSPKFYVRVMGHQWFWAYEFDCYDLGLSIRYESNLVQEADLVDGAKRLLEVDNRLYLPVNVPLRILVSSSDVLHSWAVPELGIKVDAVPGRLNDALTLIRRPGIFYGQCSELCGVGHGFMPIAVEAVSYSRWVEILRSL